MKKFLLGLAAGILLAGLTGALLLLAILQLREIRPRVSERSTLVLRLSGEIPERPPVEFPIPLLESSSPATVYEIWEMLRQAADDPRIRAVVLIPQGVSVGWARLQEIHECLRRYRASGKPLVAYLRGASGRDYYLATAADSIYMSREDLLNVKGLRAELMFLRGTLDKLGVQVELEHAGRYKDAGDTFTRTTMSPETREVLNSTLDILYADFVNTIAESRGRQPEEVRAALDDGPFLAQQALDQGLVDDILYEDEVFEQVRSRLGLDELEKLPYRRYLQALGPGLGGSSGARVALIVGEGTILGSGGEALPGDTALRASTFSSLLREVGRDSRIRGVILRINSPGGDAIASDEILREVKLLREKKPLVISMSDVAASGGYYIAMTGDPVIAYPATTTGSIGVIYGKLNLRGLYDKLGVQKEYLTRGRFAAVDSDYTPLTEPERQKLREGVDAVYQRFLEVVADGRQTSLEDVEPRAQGRAWLGVEARENGLVDELGGLDRAVELIKQRAGISAGDPVRLVTYPKKRTLLELLMEQRVTLSGDSPLTRLLGTPEIELLRTGGIMRLMPYTLRIE